MCVVRWEVWMRGGGTWLASLLDLQQEALGAALIPGSDEAGVNVCEGSMGKL